MERPQADREGHGGLRHAREGLTTDTPNAPEDVCVDSFEVAAYTIPTDAPEADGTLEWNSTTIVVVHVGAGGRTGLGYTYSASAAATLIRDMLEPLVVGATATAPADIWSTMRRRVRNVGWPGVAAAAVSAVDTALWDLHARLLEAPLANVLGRRRRSVPVYGSGGFTSYSISRLRQQLAGWVEDGIGMVKMKVGAHPEADPERVANARDAIGPRAGLFIDANGAFHPTAALRFAHRVAVHDVSWFEEPVSSDDVDGLAFVRSRAPLGMAIAAGEYAWDVFDARRLLDAAAVDVLQLDGTRCGGFTGFMAAASLADAACRPVSAHTAPALHAHICCAAPRVIHIEYFHDHARIERMLFDGVIEPVAGQLTPDLSRTGNGLTLKRDDASPYEV